MARGFTRRTQPCREPPGRLDWEKSFFQDNPHREEFFFQYNLPIQSAEKVMCVCGTGISFAEPNPTGLGCRV